MNPFWYHFYRDLIWSKKTKKKGGKMMIFFNFVSRYLKSQTSVCAIHYRGFKTSRGRYTLSRILFDLFLSRRYWSPKCWVDLTCRKRYTHNCIRFTCAMTLRGSCEHTYKDFSDLSFLLESYDIALSISIWHMPDRCISSCQESYDPWRKHICM